MASLSSAWAHGSSRQPHSSSTPGYPGRVARWYPSSTTAVTDSSSRYGGFGPVGMSGRFLAPLGLRMTTWSDSWRNHPSRSMASSTSPSKWTSDGLRDLPNARRRGLRQGEDLSGHDRRGDGRGRLAWGAGSPMDRRPEQRYVQGHVLDGPVGGISPLGVERVERPVHRLLQEPAYLQVRGPGGRVVGRFYHHVRDVHVG